MTNNQAETLNILFIDIAQNLKIDSNFCRNYTNTQYFCSCFKSNERVWKTLKYHQREDEEDE